MHFIALYCTIPYAQEAARRRSFDSGQRKRAQSMNEAIIPLHSDWVSKSYCVILFHLFDPLSVHSQPSYHSYSFFFSSFTHRLHGRCAILIEFVCTSLPTHTHTHTHPPFSPPSPPPPNSHTNTLTHTHPPPVSLPSPPHKPSLPPCRCLWDGKWKQPKRNNARKMR